jgi:hypothetical protein
MRQRANGAGAGPPRATAGFVAGAAAGGLPLVYALAVYGERFVFLTLQFHLTAVFDWYQANGLGEVLSLRYKLTELPRKLFRDGNVVIFGILALSAAVMLAARVRTPSRGRRWSSTTTALVALFCAALAFSIQVGPHAMYYAPVAALGALLAARALAAIRPRVPLPAVATLLVVALLPAGDVLTWYGERVIGSTDTSRWTGIQVHRSAKYVAQMVMEHGASGPVATLFPIVVLDANRVPPEFAAGPFFFRSAGAYSVEQIERLHGAGPQTLERLFARAEPAAVIGDFGPFRFRWKSPMDAPLLDYAEQAGYVGAAGDWKINGYRNGKIWLRAAGPRP